MNLSLLRVFLLISLLEKRSTEDNCSDGCLRCVQQNEFNICEICDVENFFVRNGYKCKQVTIENCLQSYDGIKCRVCGKGYFLNPNTFLCEKASKAIDNCVQMKDANTCAACDKNLYFDTNTSKCVAIVKDISNCLVYASASTCAICDKTKLSQDATACLSMDKSENCDYFSEALSCQTCKTGYKMYQNKYLRDI